MMFVHTLQYLQGAFSFKRGLRMPMAYFICLDSVYLRAGTFAVRTTKARP